MFCLKEHPRCQGEGLLQCKPNQTIALVNSSVAAPHPQDSSHSLLVSRPLRTPAPLPSYTLFPWLSCLEWLGVPRMGFVASHCTFNFLRFWFFFFSCMEISFLFPEVSCNCIFIAKFFLATFCCFLNPRPSSVFSKHLWARHNYCTFQLSHSRTRSPKIVTLPPRPSVSPPKTVNFSGEGYTWITLLSTQHLLSGCSPEGLRGSQHFISLVVGCSDLSK